MIKGTGPSTEDARQLAKRGDMEGALRLFREILEKDPNDQEALYGIGGVHYKKGDYKRAAEAWLRLKVLNPSYPNIDQWVAEVQKYLTPSGLSVAAPSSAAPQEPAPAYAPPPPPSAAHEDWQRQSVRVEEIDERAFEEPLPEERKATAEEEKEEWEMGAPQPWTVKAGWVAVLLYLALIAGFYFV